MNKTMLIIFLLGIHLLNATEVDQKRGLNKTEVRGAAFLPANQRFRNIYGDAGLSLQVEQARGFKRHPHLEIWGNLEWIFFNGKPRSYCGRSDIDMLNLSLGLKGIKSAYSDWIYLYGGIGPNLGVVFIENQHRCCQECSHRDRKRQSCNLGIGGVAKSGCQLFVGSHFYFDFFADYLYLPVWFKEPKDVGGLKLGGGLSARY